MPVPPVISTVAIVTYYKITAKEVSELFCFYKKVLLLIKQRMFAFHVFAFEL